MSPTNFSALDHGQVGNVPVSVPTPTVQPRNVLSGKLFNRKFARRQWRKDLGDMFRFRGRIAPTFRVFVNNAPTKNVNTPATVQAV